MHIVPPIPALLSAHCLLLIPGLVLLALLPRRDREALRLDEALYLAFALSVAASAWLALVLAEAGVFSLVTAGVLLGAASLSAALVGWRRLGWPLPRPTSWRALAPTALLLALALFLQARPSEYIVGGAIPGHTSRRWG